MDKRFELVIGTMEFAGNEEHITIADHLDNKVFMSNEEIVDKLNVMEEAKQTLIICNGTLHKKITSLKTKISQLEWEIDELKERGLTMKYEDDLETMNDDIREIYLILVELESLETGENADYTDIVTDIAHCKVLLKNRLTSLKNKQ